MSGARIQEIRRHLDKPDEVYDCELIHREPGYVVLRYVTDRPFQFAGIFIPEGSRTVGHYRAGSDCVIWEMYEPSGDKLGTLVHLCRELEVDDDQVRYLDLVLDLWFHPDGSYEILDEDELSECVSRGLITDRDAERLRWLADVLGHNLPVFIRERQPPEG
jgi:hypothetical protein